MAISFGANGAANVTGTTSFSTAYPTGVVVNKYPLTIQPTRMIHGSYHGD